MVTSAPVSAYLKRRFFLPILRVAGRLREWHAESSTSERMIDVLVQQLNFPDSTQPDKASGMNHLELLGREDSIPYNGKSLLTRAAGRFYTHELIGRHLARGTVIELQRRGSSGELTAIDPFCGDGRLVVWLLEEARAAAAPVPRRIALWDCDPRAVARASRNVQTAAERLGVRVSVDCFVGDSFTRAPGSEGEGGSFDVAITNPPWELVKPDRREMERMDDHVAAEYLDALRAFDRRLRDEFPDAQPSRRFAGWGTNLARVGTDLALRLVAPDGVCAVVSPSSLFADSNSEALRARIFDEMTLSEIAYFPAEARLFDRVDVPCVTFVATRRRSDIAEPVLTRFNREGRVEDASRIRLPHDRLRELGYVVPVSLGGGGVALLDAMAELPRFGDLEGRHRTALWAGRELDETRKERYLVSSGSHPFTKGVHVLRFGIDRNRDEHVDPLRIQLPPSVNHPRLVWRDVSRPNQKRRVQATLIPPGWVTGNSLGVAFWRDDNLLRLACLLALMSSIPFEYQLRSMLSTAHISLATVRRAHIPPMSDPLVGRLGALAVEVMDGRPAEAQLEAEVARSYGLDKDSWASMFEALPKLTAQEQQDLLGAWR